MSAIQEVELSIEHAQHLIALRDKALNLANNKDFKELVLEGYFVKEASRLALLSADPSAVAFRDEILLSIQAIGHFRNYQANIVRMGNMAERELQDHMQTLSELQQEDGE